MGIKIYMFDNQTGIDLPQKVDTFPVDLLIGTKLSDIHSMISSGAQLFCVFTPLQKTDFIVKSQRDADIINDILTFGKYDFKVTVSESSIWYSNKAENNLVISGSTGLSADELSSILAKYLSAINMERIKNGTAPNRELYSVYNTRTSVTVFKTPNRTEAESVSDRNPCTVVKTRNGTIVYKSNYGRVEIHTKSNVVSKQKARIISQGKASFKIEL